MKRFTVSQAKEVDGRDKPVWLRHGIAFQKDGKALRIKLESLPIPNREGEIWLTLFEDDGERRGEGFTPSGYDQSPGGSSGAPGGSPGASGGFDDDIPW